MYEYQVGEFVCGYWDLKGQLFACSYKCYGVKYHSSEWWKCLEYCQRPGYTLY